MIVQFLHDMVKFDSSDSLSQRRTRLVWCRSKLLRNTTEPIQTSKIERQVEPAPFKQSQRPSTLGERSLYGVEPPAYHRLASPLTRAQSLHPDDSRIAEARHPRLQ